MINEGLKTLNLGWDFSDFVLGDFGDFSVF